MCERRLGILIIFPHQLALCFVYLCHIPPDLSSLHSHAYVYKMTTVMFVFYSVENVKDRPSHL